MNNIEERLWSYIDGTCSPAEREAISQLIDSNDDYHNQYQDLLAFNQKLENIELEEPAMAFTYRVMEAVRTEEAQKPLKAAINPIVIKIIGGFFIVTIVALLIIALASNNWSAASSKVTIPVNVSAFHIKDYIGSNAMKAFLFFDTIMALFLADSYLRRKNLSSNID